MSLFMKIIMPVAFIIFFLSLHNLVNAETITQSIVTTTKTGDTQTTEATPSRTTISTRSPLDDNIVSAIYAKYAKDSALIGTNINANSENGIVTLTGTVTAQSQADAAVIAAKSVKGVKDVRSNINVITNPKPTPKPIPNY